MTNAIADYKRIMESSDIDFASHMEGIRSVLDAELFKMAWEAVGIERLPEKDKIVATDNIPPPRNPVEPGELSFKELQELEARRARMELQRALDERLWDIIVKPNKDVSHVAYYESRKKTRKEDQNQIKEQRKKLRRKIGFAVFSVLMLIVPMLIMVLHPGLLTLTATTSVFILVVGVLLAVSMKEAEPKDVVAATAAYAAVLVVFVGGGGGGQESGSGGARSAGPQKNQIMSNGKVGGIVAGLIVGTFLLLILLLVLWTFIAVQVPGIPFPLPGVENPRVDSQGNVLKPLYERQRQERMKMREIRELLEWQDMEIRERRARRDMKMGQAGGNQNPIEEERREMDERTGEV
ncbi:MAG: hypothetical protein M1823_000519 [Watsoniomyces obsoletus]|nr:MAG: hypothetical protein M1823_000519 [Watsoniomyces obsoletus]